MIEVKIDLNELWTGCEWDETVGEILRDALKTEIKAEVKAAIKKDKQLKKIVDAYLKKAKDQAMDNLGIK